MSYLREIRLRPSGKIALLPGLDNHGENTRREARLARSGEIPAMVMSHLSWHFSVGPAWRAHAGPALGVRPE